MKSTDQLRIGFVRTAVFGTGAVLASWVSSELLVAFMAASGGMLTFTVARRAVPGSPAGLAAAAVAAGSFPVWMRAAGESGLMWAASSAILLVATVLLLSRPSGSATAGAGILIWLPLYIGLGLSYAVLIRQQQPGPKLLLCLALIMFAVQGSALAASRMSGARPDNGKEGPPLLAVRLAGIAAAEVAAMASLTFLDEPFLAGPLAMLGIIVALAAMLGEASGRLLALDLPKGRTGLRPLAALDAWVMAMPAFFYSFRLYLT